MLPLKQSLGELPIMVRVSTYPQFMSSPQPWQNIYAFVKLLCCKTPIARGLSNEVCIYVFLSLVLVAHHNCYRCVFQFHARHIVLTNDFIYSSYSKSYVYYWYIITMIVPEKWNFPDVWKYTSQPSLILFLFQSRNCNLYNMGPKQLVKHGELVNETGGYFIINGACRILRCLYWSHWRDLLRSVSQCLFC